MPAKKTKGSSKSRRTTKKTGKSSASAGKERSARESEEKPDPSAERYVRDLLIRGEAAKPTAEGELPPGATHKIVDDGEEGLPKVERERFSLY